MAAADALSALELRVREERATRYDAEYVAVHGRWFPAAELAVIQRSLDLSPEDVLLDLGCGTGRLTVSLASGCRRVVAVDRFPASLAILRERARTLGLPNIADVEADASQPIRFDERVTKVLCVQLLQHIPSRDRRLRVFRNAFGALGPKGPAWRSSHRVSG